jgi:hypothetical protein
MENEYTIKLRKRILEKIEDLKSKIETNEPCPENEQTVSLLVSIDDLLEECLSNWYY